MLMYPDLHVFVPTRGRLDRQHTLRELMLERVADEICKVTVVVPECEYYDWSGGKYVETENVKLATVPDEFGFSDIRQHLLELNTDEPGHIVIDDDLRYFRRVGDTVQLEKCSWEDIKVMFDWTAEVMNEGFIHGGISVRGGNNHVKEKEVQVGREMRHHFYDRERVLATGLDFRQVKIRQDFHATLWLLRHGEPNIINYEFAQDQCGSNTDGGCSRYRTPEMLAEQAQVLADLHPGFVKVVEKYTKGAWGGGMRTDVTIQWQKAFKAADLMKG